MKAVRRQGKSLRGKIALTRMAGSSQAGEGFANVEIGWRKDISMGITRFYTFSRALRDQFLGRAEQLEQNSCVSLPVRVAILKVGHSSTGN